MLATGRKPCEKSIKLKSDLVRKHPEDSNILCERVWMGSVKF